MVINVPCPICGNKTLSSNFSIENIPYFGECLQTVILCEKCGYKSVDFLITEQHEPIHYELNITQSEDMMIRVIRSSSSTICIPEIGALVEPGPHSEGFISNVEGVIERIKNAISHSIRDTNQEKKKLGKKLLEKIDRIKEGKEEATLIIEDPFGNSAIISKKAKKRVLSKEEVDKLMKIT